MYISHTPYINQTNIRKSNFTGIRHQSPAPVVAPKQTNGLKKILPFVIGFLGICSVGGNYANPTSNLTYNGVEDSLGIHVKYHNVSKEIRDSVMKPIYELKTKLNKQNDFLNGTKIDVAKSLKEIYPSDEWRKHVIINESDSDLMGTSFYSDSKLTKRISIQEVAHEKYATINKNGQKTLLPAMRHTIMHEAGHLFDQYFGHNHNDKLAHKWDSILASKLNRPFESPYDFDMSLEEEKIDDIFIKRDCLNDKLEFKKAFFADINNLKNIPQDKLPLDIDYYAGDLDFKKAIPWREIELADEARGEAYANLFAYIIGENDGQKDKFVKCFSNCNSVVKKDVAKFLKLVK